MDGTSEMTSMDKLGRSDGRQFLCKSIETQNECTFLFLQEWRQKFEAFELLEHIISFKSVQSLVSRLPLLFYRWWDSSNHWRRHRKREQWTRGRLIHPNKSNRDVSVCTPAQYRASYDAPLSIKWSKCLWQHDCPSFVYIGDTVLQVGHKRIVNI